MFWAVNLPTKNLESFNCADSGILVIVLSYIPFAPSVSEVTIIWFKIIISFCLAAIFFSFYEDIQLSSKQIARYHFPLSFAWICKFDLSSSCRNYIIIPSTRDKKFLTKLDEWSIIWNKAFNNSSRWPMTSSHSSNASRMIVVFWIQICKVNNHVTAILEI